MGGAPDVTPDITPDITADPMSHLDAILKSTLDKDTVKLEWHPDLPMDSIDPLGMEDEFRSDGPLQPQPTEDPDKEERDLKWDINPALNRSQRRTVLKLLCKFLRIFAGPEGKNLGKVSSKFDFDIDSNPTEIKSQQPYRTSPRKWKMIHEAIKKLGELDVIEPATADNAQIASPIVIVIQKGKP